MKSKPIGLSLPIQKMFWENISKVKNPIFFKFMPHESIPKELDKNSKLFFYLSNSGKLIVGESQIQKTELINVEDFVKNFKDKILIPLTEFYEYVGGRKDKLLVIFFLKDIKEYNNPVKLNYSVTMGGKYIRKKEYSSWKNQHTKYHHQA